MLDKIQFLLSMQIIGLCVLGGIMMLLRSFGNRARLILAWSMIMWALMAVIRISVNSYVDEAKEAFHPDVLIASCFVTACLASYVIEKLRWFIVSYLSVIGWGNPCFLFDKRCFYAF